jgi:hypothetical protein
VGGGSHQQSTAADEGQDCPCHICCQRKPIAPVQPVLGNVVDVVSDEGDVEQGLQPMPCGIVVPYRVVIDIRISLPRLRALALLGDQAVGLGKSA